MTLREQTALVLDTSLSAASKKRGLYTDKVRATLSAYLDGTVKLDASTVRKYALYLAMISKGAS